MNKSDEIVRTAASSFKSLGESQTAYFNKVMHEFRTNADTSAKLGEAALHYSQKMCGHYADIMQKTFEEIGAIGQDLGRARDSETVMALQRKAGAHVMRHTAEHLKEMVLGAIEVNDVALELVREWLDDAIEAATEQGGGETTRARRPAQAK